MRTRLITNKNKNKNIGFIIYFILIIVIIPLILLKYEYYVILSMYLPNVDMIATLFTYKSNTFDIDYFSELYSQNPQTTWGIINQKIINYLSLLGLTYLVAKHTLDTKSISRGWSIAFVMTLMTYLLPGIIIPKLMDIIYNIIDYGLKKLDKNNILKKYNIFNKLDLPFIISLSVGIFFTVLVIYSESKILHKYSKILSEIAEYIMNFSNII